MWILAYFTRDGEPATGLSPLVKIRDVDTGVVVISGSSMIERGDGFYGYDFSAYNPQKDYAIICDSVTLSGVERYTYASSGEYNEVLDDIESTVGIVDIRTTLLRKIQTNRLELFDGDTNNWILYDDDATTPLLTFDVSDKDGGIVVQCPQSPSKRSGVSGLPSGILSPDIYMRKSVYDPDDDGLVSSAENISDGIYTSTASGVKYAVDNAHLPCFLGTKCVDESNIGHNLLVSYNAYTDRLEYVTITGAVLQYITDLDATPWKVFYSDGAGSIQELPLSVSGTYLKSNGVSAAPSWAEVVTDHGYLTGLTDDDHPQYILTTGIREFTGTVSGIDPTQPAHLTTKNYVDTNFSLIGHFHTESDITDLLHNAVQLQGYDIDSSAPAHMNILVWDNDDAKWEPATINYVGGLEVSFDGDTITWSGAVGLENVVEDLTPQLGGDLDTLGNAIYNTTGSTIILGRDNENESVILGEGTPAAYNNYIVLDTTNASERVIIWKDLEIKTGNELRFYDTDESNYVGFKAPSLSGNQIWTLPESDGTDGQVLITDGAGNLSFITMSGVATASGLDHGGLVGLGDDDHPQYILADGSRPFTSTVGGVWPVSGSDLVTKDYVTSISGIQTASNLGTGEGVFAQRAGLDLQFRSLLGAGTITLISGTNEITISGSGAADHGSLTGLGDDDHPQYLKNIIEDTSPQLGGYLDTNSYEIRSSSPSAQLKLRSYGRMFLYVPDNDDYAFNIQDKDNYRDQLIISTDNADEYVWLRKVRLALTSTTIDEFSTDGTLSGNSDTALPTEQAVKTYIDTHASAASAHHVRYTDEEAQDAVGTVMSGVGGISVIYDDAANSITISGGDVVTDHGILTGLTDQDHPASAIYTNTVTFSGILSSIDTDVQTALETLDQHGPHGVSEGVAGRVTIVSGSTSTTVNLPVQITGDYVVAVNIVNDSDPLPSQYAHTTTDLTSTSFTVNYSGDIDSDNYVLHWTIASGVFEVLDEYYTKDEVDALLGVNKSGKESLLQGDTETTVTFASSFDNGDYVVFVTLENEVDSTVSEYALTVTDTSPSGFTVDYSGEIDSNNYYLNWYATSSGIYGGNYITEIKDDESPELGGDLNLGNYSVVLNTTPSGGVISGYTVGWSGEVSRMTIDWNDTGFACPLHMKSNGNWEQCTAASGTTRMPCLALALETGTGSKLILWRGIIRKGTWPWSPGDIIYVSTVEGALTNVEPTAEGTWSQAVGVMIGSDTMRFDPAFDIGNRN